MLVARLEAAGIEACIPEEYGPQLFSTVIPLGCVTVRVAVKDVEAARAIAVGMAEAEPSSAGEDSLEAGVDAAVGETGRSRPPGLTRQMAGVISAMVVVGPILFGVLVHLIRESAAMGPFFWLWALFSAACLFWGRYVSRKYRPLALSCMAIGTLQLISFLILFMAIDFPANSRSVPFTQQPNWNSHNW